MLSETSIRLGVGSDMVPQVHTACFQTHTQQFNDLPKAAKRKWYIDAEASKQRKTESLNDDRSHMLTRRSLLIQRERELDDSIGVPNVMASIRLSDEDMEHVAALFNGAGAVSQRPFVLEPPEAPDDGMKEVFSRFEPKRSDALDSGGAMWMLKYITKNRDSFCELCLVLGRFPHSIFDVVCDTAT